MLRFFEGRRRRRLVLLLLVVVVAAAVFSSRTRTPVCAAVVAAGVSPRCLAFTAAVARSGGGSKKATDTGGVVVVAPVTDAPFRRRGKARTTDRSFAAIGMGVLRTHRNDNDNDNGGDADAFPSSLPSTERLVEDAIPSSSSSSFSSSSWGGDRSEDAGIAARLVLDATELCREYKHRRRQRQQREPTEDDDRDETTATSAAAVEASAFASALDKTDGTPVTALDFAIQGFVVSSLRRYEALRSSGSSDSSSSDDDDDHRHRSVSFWGEEDASDLRRNEDLSRSALELARSLDPNLTSEEFFDALDGNRSNSNSSINNNNKKNKDPDDTNDGGGGRDDRLPGRPSHHRRCWILDPIDGTRGLLTGKGFAIGLALCVGGEAVVGIVGNPSVTDPDLRVMASVRGHGLRYRRGHGEDRKNNNDDDDGTDDDDDDGTNDDDDDGTDDDSSGGGRAVEDKLFWDPPRKIPDSWHTRDYDVERISSSSSSPSSRTPPILRAGVDYPPFYLSRGPKPATTTTKDGDRAAAADEMLPPTPRPFGPSCPPTELCCGSLVKYYAIASGRAAGFLQLSRSATVKSWDHAAGLLCVVESGGTALVVEAKSADDGDDDDDETAIESRLPRFDRPEFPIHRGIVCVSREADGATMRRLVDSVRAIR